MAAGSTMVRIMGSAPTVTTPSRAPSSAAMSAWILRSSANTRLKRTTQRSPTGVGTVPRAVRWNSRCARFFFQLGDRCADGRLRQAAGMGDGGHVMHVGQQGGAGQAARVEQRGRSRRRRWRRPARAAAPGPRRERRPVRLRCAGRAPARPRPRRSAACLSPCVRTAPPPRLRSRCPIARVTARGRPEQRFRGPAHAARRGHRGKDVQMMQAGARRPCPVPCRAATAK